MRTVEAEERAVYMAIPQMEVGKLVKEVMVAADTVALGEHSRIVILGPIRSGEKRDCHTAARVVWAVVEEVDWRSRTRMPIEVDFRNLMDTGC